MSRVVRLANLVCRKLAGLLTTLLVGALLAATLIRISPGWDVDERAMDLRRSEESIRALREPEQSMPQFYVSYMKRLLAGNLGISRMSERPVSGLIAERAGVTLRTAGLGYTLAWAWGLGIAITVVALRWMALETASAAASGLLLSLPAACIGFIALWTGVGTEWAIAAVLFPKIFRYSAGLFRQIYSQQHVTLALAKGLSTFRIMTAHVVRPALSELLALAAATTALAFGAAVPLEVVCDSPGLGQLAWQAAMARDLPVLVALTLMVTLLVKASALLADVVRSGLPEERL